MDYLKKGVFENENLNLLILFLFFPSVFNCLINVCMSHSNITSIRYLKKKHEYNSFYILQISGIFFIIYMCMYIAQYRNILSKKIGELKLLTSNLKNYILWRMYRIRQWLSYASFSFFLFVWHSDLSVTHSKKRSYIRETYLLKWCVHVFSKIET